jgi:hypothetical protein
MNRFLTLLLVLGLSTAARADEGMWRPEQLPQLADELRGLGLEIDPQSLSSLMEHPMNAVISLGGCTASFVSPEGLVVTNHHCAYGALQYNSTEESNLMEDGFLAADRAAERPAGPGARVLVTVEVTDVTDQIMASVPEGADGRARYQAIEDHEKALVAGCEEDAGHRCAVRTYHGGLEYELIKQLEIKDVRLVYAPSAAIGIYGGEIDNWMWPRHTGDFAYYRAYVSPDGQPAEFDEANVPYEPRHVLQVSTEGVSAGDLVMVAGYPGTTNRYRLAAEVWNQFEWDYPTRKRIFEEWRQTISEAAPDGSDAGIKYSSLMRGLDNATKNYGGMIDGYAKTNVYEQKEQLHEALEAWIKADPARAAKYETPFHALEGLVLESLSKRESDFYYEYLARRGELLRTARTLYRLSKERQKPDAEREPGYQERDLGRLKERMTRLERTLEPSVDRAFWRKFILHYVATEPKHHEPIFDGWFGVDGSQIDETALDAKLDEMYAGTKLADTEERLAWLERSPAEFEASEDPFIRLAVKMFESDMRREEEAKALAGRYDAARPQYMAALIDFLGSQGRPIYPDANSTLRVTFGTVKGYKPRDAVRYTPFTGLGGIVEKHTGEDPFDATEAQLALIGEEKYGDYFNEEVGSVPVNFLSTVDTTGGNSGSPTLNGRGELVGLLFDGNWESIISDWNFSPERTRSIHVDARYMLWVMEHLDGAHHLLREMGVKSE